MFVPHEIFERKPLLGLLLGTVSLGLGLLGFLVIGREYRGFGKQPESVDLRNVVVPPEMHGKWVRVNQQLKVNCEGVEVENQLEHQLLFGRVQSTYFLAEVEGANRSVVLQRHKKAVCDQLRNGPYVGVLNEINPQLRRTLDRGGMILPLDHSAMLLCLSCGPEDSKKYLYFFSVLIAASLWLMNRYWRKYLRKVTFRESTSMGS